MLLNGALALDVVCASLNVGFAAVAQFSVTDTTIQSGFRRINEFLGTRDRDLGTGYSASGGHSSFNTASQICTETLIWSITPSLLHAACKTHSTCARQSDAFHGVGDLGFNGA